MLSSSEEGLVNLVTDKINLQITVEDQRHWIEEINNINGIINVYTRQTTVQIVTVLEKQY
ncbi:hypothetical protein [Enterococcus mundtii]|uniref:hypothetical protein n=1 Tax=Enterococcus mundtii TaxID=53346 RepID=UPI0035C75243